MGRIREDEMGGRGEKEGELEDWDGQDWVRTEIESKERHIFTEGAIMRLVRNLELKKFPGPPRMIPAKTLSNSGEGA